MNLKNLNEIKTRLETSQKSHFVCAEINQRKHYWIGAIAVISTTVSTSLMFMNFGDGDTALRIAYGILGVFAAVLVAIQTFSRFLEKFEAHRNSAIKYGELVRRIQFSESVDIDKLLSDWKAVSEQSPVTPKRLRQKNRSIAETDNG